MGGLGMTEVLVVLGIVLLLFGGRLPALGKSLGEGIRGFKKGLSGDDAAEAAQSKGAHGTSPSPAQGPHASQTTQHGQSPQPGPAGVTGPAIAASPVTAQAVPPASLPTAQARPQPTDSGHAGGPSGKGSDPDADRARREFIDVEHRDVQSK